MATKGGRTESSSSNEVPQGLAASATTQIEHLSLLDIYSPVTVIRNTGIVCTIGKYVLTPQFNLVVQS